MKPIGVIKTVDNAGRLIIPAEIRERLGLYGAVELIMTDEGLLV
jgi:AbrB family looped-hinge helix DNA binding protein